MSSKILFGNSVGYKINNYLTKKKIIDYLQNSVDIFCLKDNLIVNEEDLIKIKNEEYVVIPNIVGEDYIFLAIKINESYFVVLIEKKTLNDFNNINYNNLNIVYIQIRLKVETYKGTIFDGRIVNLGGCCAFIINKIYMLNGNNLINKKINESYKLAEDFISNSYVIDPNMNTILFKLNKIYKLSEINDLVNDKIQNSKFKFSSIDFINCYCNKTYRYYYTNQDYDKKIVTMYGKLINVDVVELFSKDVNDKIRRIGIAHIPDIKTSQICNNYVSTSVLTPIKCKLSYRFKKWVPEEIYLENKDICSYEDITNKMLDVISH